MTNSVLCGRPTPAGSCRRPVTAPGAPCGVAHPAPPARPPGAAAVAAAGPDPFDDDSFDDDTCSQCGEPCDDGEGWDGLCGDCADRAFAAEEAEEAVAEALAEGTSFAEVAADDDPWIRRAVAARRSCPPAVLEVLAADPDSDVRAAAVANPACPPAARAHAGLLDD